MYVCMYSHLFSLNALNRSFTNRKIQWPSCVDQASIQSITVLENKATLQNVLGLICYIITLKIYNTNLGTQLECLVIPVLTGIDL